MRIAITIVHNKFDSDNEAQIQALLPHVEKITDLHDEFDDQGNVTGQFETYHYEIRNLGLEHEVRFYQVVPFGVSRPPSFNLLDSHNVLYGAGDEDKTGEHPRFFNWGLKRGTDYGAEISIYLNNPTAFTPQALRGAINQLKNDVEFVDLPWAKLGTLRLLKSIGQLKEDRGFSQAVSELKERVIKGGLRNG